MVEKEQEVEVGRIERLKRRERRLMGWKKRVVESRKKRGGGASEREQKLEVRREELLGAPEGGRVETNLYHAFERGT